MADAVNNLTFWWSILSTIIGVLLLVVSVGLAIYTWSDNKNKKSQIKIWMQDANGVQQSLRRIVIDNLERRYSSINDMANAIWAVQAMAFSLYQSLFEERCVKEEDFIKEQQELKDEIKKESRKNRSDAARAIRKPQTPTASN